MLRSLVGIVVRPARALIEPLRAVTQVALHELVARLTTDAVAIAKLAHRVLGAQVIGDELRFLVHRCSFPPRHGAPPPVPPIIGKCYPCPFTKLLPMSPDRTK